MNGKTGIMAKNCNAGVGSADVIFDFDALSSSSASLPRRIWASRSAVSSPSWVSYFWFRHAVFSLVIGSLCSPKTVDVRA